MEALNKEGATELGFFSAEYHNEDTSVTLRMTTLLIRHLLDDVTSIM